MRITETDLPGVRLVEPRTFEDDRGFFLETFRDERFAEAGLPTAFVQDNWSRSRRGALRGLHVQLSRPQGKLVWVVRGRIFDVAVDLRPGSPTFGRWASFELSDENRRQVYLPPGFAHGFYTLSDWTDVCYKCTDRYAPGDERTLRWDDPEVGIAWPTGEGPILSEKDRAGVLLAELRRELLAITNARPA